MTDYGTECQYCRDSQPHSVDCEHFYPDGSPCPVYAKWLDDKFNGPRPTGGQPFFDLKQLPRDLDEVLR